MAKIIAIPDTHFPFHCEKTLAKVIDVVEEEQPDYVLQLGDLLDCISAGKYPKLFKILPSDEISQGRKFAEKMWHDIQEVSPKSKCIQLCGNHDFRPIKLLMDRCPELEPFMDVQSFFEFKGVKTIFNPREGYEVDDILFIHGFLHGLGKHALFFNKRVCRGHSHHAGIVFYNNNGAKGGCIWEVESGYLGATEALPFRFTPSKFTQWRRGITLIENKIPKFIPL